jgi:hypothetical protein
VKNKGAKKKKKHQKEATCSSNIPKTSITEAIVEKDGKYQPGKPSTSSNTISPKLSSVVGFQTLPENSIPEVIIPVIKSVSKSVTIKNGHTMTLTK